jgi:uncharacterized membrane protein YGL010W
MVPAVARKLAELVPALIVTLAGMLSNCVLRVNATVADEAAAFVNVTVQVALCPLLSVVGVQLNDDS